MKISLINGAYTTQSLIADAQRCVNLYPEINPRDAEQPVSHLPTPGLTQLLAGTSTQVAPVRGLFFASNLQLYAVVGTGVYYIDAQFTPHLLGSIQSKTTPVSMMDNGIDLLLVDGSSNGYVIVLATNAFSVLSDPTGLFSGADRVDYVDSFFVFNQPGTRNFYSSLSNVITFDPTYIAAKTSFADLLQTIIVNHRIIWLLGTFTSEPWYNAGNPTFPFALQPGVFIQYGCAAKYSAASDGDSIFWLSQDKNGKAQVIMGKGFETKIISTFAIAQELSAYSVLSDAIGFAYQQNGHSFYFLTFPTADRTWVYDKTVDMWHERSSRDANGLEHRHRANCHAFAYGQNVVGDWQNGNIYLLDLANYTDNGISIVRRRGFPHLANDGKRMRHTAFLADIETGTILNAMWEGTPNQPRGPDFNADFNSDFNVAPGTQEALPNPYTGPSISLRWSDDRGQSWSQPLLLPVGASGQYNETPTWRRLGVSRYRTYELFWDVAAPIAIQGAFINVEPGAT